ncbi:MAG: sulfatase [Elusimicrobiota bacterium]
MKNVLLDDEFESFNYPFWQAVLFLWTATNLIFARKFYAAAEPAFWLCFLSAELRALLAVCLTVLLGGMLARRFGAWARAGIEAAFLLFSILELAAACLYSVLGMTLSTSVNLLFAARDSGPWTVLRDTEMPPWSMAAAAASVMGAFALGLWFRSLTARRASRKRSRLAVAPVLAACYAAVLLIAAEQAVGGRFKNQKTWLEEQRSMPLYAPLWTPHGLCEYEAVAAPFVRSDLEASGRRISTVAGKKNRTVILIVLESVREDAVTAETAPNLFKFRAENVSFRDAYSNGNATVLSWYAILTSHYPFHLIRAMAQPDWAGAATFSILRNAGFENFVFSSGLSYFGYRRIAFGTGGRLAQIQDSSDEALSIPEKDRQAERGLLAAVASNERAGGKFYVLFLDSTHAPYTWPADLKAKFSPYALGLSGPGLVARLRNRYRNALAYDDSLFGDLIDQLKARGLYRDAAIVVVSDHGQEFMEHGGLFHGATLYNDQVRVPIFLKIPGVAPGVRPGTVSQIDIMPTLLDYLGLYRGAESLMEGRSVLKSDSTSVLTLGSLNSLVPVRAVLTTGRWRIEFVLEPGPDGAVRRLTVWDVRDREDRAFVPGRGEASDYREFLDREFVPALDGTGLLRAAR